jgi:hypothetical protein
MAVVAVVGGRWWSTGFPNKYAGGAAGDGTASSISGTSTFYAGGAIGVGVNGPGSGGSAGGATTAGGANTGTGGSSSYDTWQAAQES